MDEHSANKWRKARDRGPLIGLWPRERVLKFVVGLILLLLASSPFFRFPVVLFWLLPLGAIYLGLLLILPRLWLVLLPVATVTVDLTAWTGRFIYNELDLLFLLTLASGFLYNRYRFRVFAPGPATLVLGSYLLVVAIGCTGWWLFLDPPEASWQYFYFTDDYAYTVAKGLLWGIALVPMWGYVLVRDKQRTVDALVTGGSLAALCLGLVVLREHGALGLLFSGGETAGTLPDDGVHARPTAWSSDMHIGGVAVDGLVLLLLPVTLYALAWGQMKALRLLGLAGLLALSYVTLAGFTPATCVAFTLGITCYAGYVLSYRRASGIPLSIPVWRLAVCVAICTLAAVLAYRLAGNIGLTGYTVCMLLVGFWQFRGADVLAGLDRAQALATFLAVPVFFALALGGHPVDQPARVATDWDTRVGHWREVISGSGDELWRPLLGNGVGKLPAYPSVTGSGGAGHAAGLSVISRRLERILRIDGGWGPAVGQRVVIQPNTLYALRMRFRAAEAGILTVSLCEQDPRFAVGFAPECVTGAVEFGGKEASVQETYLGLNSGPVGSRGGISRWPTVVSLQLDEPGKAIEIDTVEFSADGFNLLRNNSFHDGLDQWFPLGDYAQLPWHSKNLFLQLWFETGWLGLGLFLGLIGLLIRGTSDRHAVDSLTPVYLTGVLSVCVYGLFGSPLESARVSWLFYFFLVAGLVKLRARKRSHTLARARI